jgi:hypothetical protein
MDRDSHRKPYVKYFIFHNHIGHHSSQHGDLLMCIGLGEVDEEGSKEESKTSPDLDLKLDPLDRIFGI